MCFVYESVLEIKVKRGSKNRQANRYERREARAHEVGRSRWPQECINDVCI